MAAVRLCGSTAAVRSTPEASALSRLRATRCPRSAQQAVHRALLKREAGPHGSAEQGEAGSAQFVLDDQNKPGG
jgi:hypothetical protein